MGILAELVFGDGVAPRGGCLHWDPDLLTWTLLGDAGISIAFKLLPVMLLVEARRRRLTMPAWVLILFSTFILLCSFSYDLSIWTLFWPAYWLETAVKNATSVVSLLTVALVPFASPRNGNSVLWWRRARALRHELRSARSNINLLRGQLNMPPMMWPDDALPPGPDDINER